MATQRVVIVGAGVLGLFTALELLDDDWFDVTVIEEHHPGGGSSGRSVGMVETQYFTRAAVEVRAYGRQVFEDLERDHGLSFSHCGYLRLARTQEDLANFSRSIDVQRKFGIDDAELLTRDQISQRWPHLIIKDISGGLFGAWDGFVDGFELCQKLAHLVRVRGGTVMTGAPLTGAIRQGETWRIHAGKDQIEADLIVNAAGPQAGIVGELLGAPVPLIPQLHGAITVRLPSTEARTPFVMDYIPGSGVDGVYFRSEGAGHLVAGLHSEETVGERVDPDAVLRSVDQSVIERIVARLMDRITGADELQLDRSWQGIYPMTPDGNPIVGRHPAASSVVCAVGGGGSGIQLSPAIGRLVVDAIRDNTEPAFQIANEWNAERVSTLRTQSQANQWSLSEYNE